MQQSRVEADPMASLLMQQQMMEPVQQEDAEMTDEQLL